MPQVRALEGKKTLAEKLVLNNSTSAIDRVTNAVGGGVTAVGGGVTAVGGGLGKVAGLLTPAQLKRKEAIEKEAKEPAIHAHGSPHHLGDLCLGMKGCITTDRAKAGDKSLV